MFGTTQTALTAVSAAVAGAAFAVAPWLPFVSAAVLTAVAPWWSPHWSGAGCPATSTPRSTTWASPPTPSGTGRSVAVPGRPPSRT